jgi:outer membrane protein TolC
MIHVSGGIFLPRGAGQRQSGPPVPAIVLLLWLVLCAGPVFSQQPPSPAEVSSAEVSSAEASSAGVWAISPNEAVELALKNNLDLQSSQVTVDTKKRKADTAWNVFIPSVSVNGMLSRDNEAATVTGLVPVDLSTFLPGIPAGAPVFGVSPYSVEAPQWHIAGSLSVSLNISFALFEGMRSLRLDYQGGLISYEKAKAQLERDVRKSYYQMLLLGEQIGLLKESYLTAQRRVDMAETNYRSGLVPELTWLQARVAMENMKPSIDQAENGLSLAMASFAMNLGLPYDTKFELIPVSGEASFIPLDTADLISKAAAGKPEILELRQSIILLESGRKAQFYQNYTPYLSLSWNMAPAFTADPWKDSWFNGDNWRKSGSFSLTLGMRLDNLLPFSAGPQNIKNMDDNLRSLNIGLAQAIRGTELEIYNTILSLERARTTAEAQELTADLAERTYRLTEEAYQAGLNDLMEVQNTELELRKARLGVLEQHFNYLTGLIDLEYAIGAPFGALTSRGSVNE